MRIPGSFHRKPDFSAARGCLSIETGRERPVIAGYFRDLTFAFSAGLWFLQGFGRGTYPQVPAKAATRKRIHKLGNPVRAKLWQFWLLFVLTVAASSVAGEAKDARPVNTTQLAAWLTGGVSSARLAHLVSVRGLATLPTQAELRQLEVAGAGKDLMRVASSGNAASAQIGPAIPSGLLKAS